MILLLVQWFCEYMAQHTLHNRNLTLDPAESYRQVQDQKQLSHLQQKRIENRTCHLRNQIIMINSSTVRNNWFYFSIFVLQGQKRPKFHLLTYKSHFNGNFCACLNHTPLLSSPLSQTDRCLSNSPWFRRNCTTGINTLFHLLKSEVTRA